MKTDKRLFAGIITVLALLNWTDVGHAAPRAPQPPWPEETIRTFGFDSGYARGPWRNLALNEDNATLLESWSGFALSREASRESFLPAPVLIPALASEQEMNFSPAAGAIRFWFAANWSTASKASGGSGPGHAARLLELVDLNGKKAKTRWSLFFNAAGDTLFLAGETKLGAAVVVQAPVEFTAGDWRLITLCYSETNVVLQLDTQTIAQGAGLVAPAAWEEQNLGLVIGSDLYASADSLAEGQFDEVVTKRRWPTKMDWQEMYFNSGKRRSLLGAQGTKEEEQAKMVALKSVGLLPEEYGVTTQSLLGEAGGTMAYSYAEGSLWLEILSVTNGQANLIVHGTEPDVAYEILSKETLTNAAWAGELPIIRGAAGQDWTAATVAIGARTNSLFLWARVLRDTDGDGLPDWWELDNGLDPNNPDTGNTGVPDGYKDSDHDGWTNLQEYQNGTSPGLFNTPAAPTGLVVVLSSGGTTATVNWTPSYGAVMGYALERSFTDQALQVASGVATVTDNNVLFPEGWLYGEYEAPQYRLRAEFNGGSSAWTSWAMPAACEAPIFERIIGANNTLLLRVLNPGTAVALRVGEWDYDLDRAVASSAVDLSLANLTNGLLSLPESIANFETANGYYYVQFMHANNIPSAANFYVSLPWSSPPQFHDGRAQLKDNLRFLLRVATPMNSFGFTRHNGAFETTTSMPSDYAYAGFLSISSAGIPQAIVREFLPFEDNYDYRNLVFDPDYLDEDGVLATGMYYSQSFLGVGDPRAFKFEPQSGVSNGASILTAAETIWTVWNGSNPKLAYLPLGNVGVTVDFSVDGIPVYSMTAGARNLYGLPYLSFVVADTNGISLLNPGTSNDSAGGYVYPQTAQPELQTVDYYFARQYGTWYGRLDAPKLPGHPTFSPTNTSSLLIAGIGQAGFRVAGYAKLAVSNGYPGVYGFLGQYFDQAFLTTNGVVTTNETGMLTPYGEFFPTEPGRTALVTMPDLETGERGTATVYVVSMNLDANHDGTMDRTFFGSDQTSATKPFRFWVNNDRDVIKDIDDWGQDVESLHSYLYDYKFPIIRSVRDLEDFARLWICGIPVLVTNAGYQVTLSWNVSSGSPAINLFRAVEAGGGTGYLTDTNTALAQIASVTPASPGWTIGSVTATTPFTFPGHYFTNEAIRYLLFEGAGIGAGELVLTISQGTNVLMQTSAWLDLRDVKEMIEWAHAENVTSALPPSTLVSQFKLDRPIAATVGDDKQIIVFVHGINNSQFAYENTTETMFKRLYWSGYQGRVTGFRWPCSYLPKEDSINPVEYLKALNYNKGEFYAWKSANAFKLYLQDLTNRLAGHQINILAHSQGNTVASEAIRQGAPFDNYILSQAAVPAHCYDTSTNVPFLQKFLNAEVIKPTPFYPTNGGYHGYFENLSGNIVNFFNPQDYALATGTFLSAQANWEKNHESQKPEDFSYMFGPGYSYLPTTGESRRTYYLPDASMETVTDVYEKMGVIARTRSKAIGALAGVMSAVDNEFNLQTTFSFGTSRDEHSGQFTRPTQTAWGYYDEVLTGFGIQHIAR